jgi:preflagellin peptidase FlaK
MVSLAVALQPALVTPGGVWNAVQALATPPDALRLLALPVFAWAAWRDVETRRVPNATWVPLLAVALFALAWEGWRVATGAALADPLVYGLRVVGGVTLLVALAYVLWAVGAFGGADAKALMVLAVLFPTYPAYLLPWTALPVTETTVGVFSLTILSNTVLVAALYPVALAARNLLAGRRADWRAMVLGRPVAWQRLLDTHGRVLETPDSTFDNALDTTALGRYCRWRGTPLDTLRVDPDRYRDPATLPAGLGRDGARDSETDSSEMGDPWGAAAFYEATDASGSPERLRDALDVVARQADAWVMPGVPYVVPMFLGLLVSVGYGDVLVAVISAVAGLLGLA